MNHLDFFVAILSTWRISAMLSYERGTFGIFLKLREKIGIMHDDNGEIIDSNGSLLAELFECIWCLSVWVALFVGLIVYFCPVCVWLFYPFALSAGAILVERWARD